MSKPIRFPLIAAIMAFITFFVATQYLTFQQYEINKDREQELLLHELNRVNDKFRNILSANLIATNALALFYKENNQFSEKFDSIAAPLIKGNTSIDALQLIQNGIITDVYPLKGFEKTIGVSIYSNSLLTWEANTAIKNKEIFFAGPRKLLNGDIGIVGKMPVFVNNNPKGFITSIVKLSTIKRAIEPSDNTIKDQFTYTLIKKIDKGRQTSFNLSDVKTNKKSQIVSIDIPRGNWTLQLAYSENHPLNLFPYTLSFFGIVISLFSAIFTYRKTSEQSSLKESVEEKEYLLNERVKELSTAYKIDYIFSDESLPTGEKLSKIVNLIPQGFQYPEICEARICFRNDSYITKGYKESDINLVVKINLPDDQNGILEVVYTEKPPHTNENFFLEEEFHLIDSITKKASVYLTKKLHKDALNHSEELFKLSFEKAAIGKVIASPDKRFLTVNDAFCNLLGYSRSELLELDFNQISYPEDATKDSVAYNELLNGKRETYQTEKRYLHKSGSVIWTNVNVVIIRDENNNPLYFILQIENITEKKESETIFKDLVEKSQVGVFIVQDGKFVYVNPEIIQELGYSEEEIIGMPATSLTYLDDVPTVINNIKQREQGIENRFRYENRIVRKDGSLVWGELYTSGTIYKGNLAVIGTFINKTDEKMAVAELEKSEANLKSIFNSTEVSYLLLDKNFKVLSFNSYFKEYHFDQIGNDLITNISLIDQIPLKERKKVEKNLQEVIKLGKPFQFEEKSHFKRSNTTKYYQYMVSPVKNNGEIIGVCVANIDVTDKKNLEQERELIINDLMIKNRDLEQFSYIVSHNMRVPIANLLGLVMLLDDADLTSEDFKFIKVAFQQSATDLDSVIKDVNNVLNLNKNHLQTKNRIDLAKLIETIKIELVDNIQKTNAKIEFDFSASPEIHSIETYLYNVFLNLISNSLKFTSQNVNPEIKIWSERRDENVLIHFKDNGIGIDLDRYGNQVFGLYKRFDMTKEGKGIGLFIAKALINSLKGNISVKSNPNKGATFSITLPKEMLQIS